jgi:hypothetical protein
MKHLTNEEGIDFVNEALPAGKRAEVQAHLDSGCAHCNELVALWKHVRHSAAAESTYQPPGTSVRVAKAAFATAGLALGPAAVKLLFDSDLQPAAAGFRSAASTTRQVLYGAGPYLLDLHLAPKAEGKAVIITGQLLNSQYPEQMLPDVPIVVSNCKGSSALATTNRFGEFRGEVENSGELELRLPSPKGDDFVIALGCLLKGFLRETKDESQQTS